MKTNSLILLAAKGGEYSDIPVEFSACHWISFTLIGLALLLLGYLIWKLLDRLEKIVMMWWQGRVK